MLYQYPTVQIFWAIHLSLLFCQFKDWIPGADRVPEAAGDRCDGLIVVNQHR